MTYNIPQFPYQRPIPAPAPPPQNVEPDIEEESEEDEPQSRPSFDIGGSIQRAVSNPTEGITDYSEKDAEDDLMYDSDSPDSEDGLDRTDVDDILDVDMGEVTGYAEDSDRPKKQRFARTAKKFRPNNPPTMGGIQI